jgi:hypothetical protein
VFGGRRDIAETNLSEAMPMLKSVNPGSAPTAEPEPTPDGTGVFVATFMVSLFGTPLAFLSSGRAADTRGPVALLIVWLGLITVAGLIGLIFLIPPASRSRGTFLLRVMLSGWAGVLASMFFLILLV